MLTAKGEMLHCPLSDSEEFLGDFRSRAGAYSTKNPLGSVKDHAATKTA